MLLAIRCWRLSMMSYMRRCPGIGMLRLLSNCNSLLAA